MEKNQTEAVSFYFFEYMVRMETYKKCRYFVEILSNSLLDYTFQRAALVTTQGSQAVAVR